jgi:hypothetical protein
MRHSLPENDIVISVMNVLGQLRNGGACRARVNLARLIGPSTIADLCKIVSS